MKTAIYFDDTVNDSEFTHFSKEVIENLAKKHNIKVLDYNTVADFLREGSEKALIFAQDVIPYTAYNNSYL